jgi:hypothetical protein
LVLESTVEITPMRVKKILALISPMFRTSLWERQRAGYTQHNYERRGRIRRSKFGALGRSALSL